MVVPIRVASMTQCDLFANYLYKIKILDIIESYTKDSYETIQKNETINICNSPNSKHKITPDKLACC